MYRVRRVSWLSWLLNWSRDLGKEPLQLTQGVGSRGIWHWGRMSVGLRGYGSDVVGAGGVSSQSSGV